MAGMSRWVGGTTWLYYMQYHCHSLKASCLSCNRLLLLENRKRMIWVWRIMTYQIILSLGNLRKAQYLRRWYRTDEFWFNEEEEKTIWKLGVISEGSADDGMVLIGRRKKLWRWTFLGSQVSWKFTRERLTWSNLQKNLGWNYNYIRFPHIQLLGLVPSRWREGNHILRLPTGG